MNFNRTAFLRGSIFSNGLSERVLSNVAQSAVWKHYAVTTTATTTELYVNGVLVESVNFAWAGDTSNVFIGGFLGFALFSGRLDDIRLYGRALSATEISDLYTSTL
jgi:hypothetical protein